MATEVLLPELGENIEKGDIVKWLVKVGDTIQLDQPIMEIETGKAVVEVPSNAAGTITALHFEEGDTAKVGEAVLSVASDKQNGANKPEAKKPAPAAASKPTEQPVVAAKTTTPETAPKTNGSSKPIPATPGVKRVAREAGIDIASVEGTGPAGRITVGDLAARLPGGTPTVAGVKLPDFSQWGEIEAKPFSAVRRATVDHLSRSWPATPQVTQFDKADVTELEVLRKKYAPDAEARSGKLTMTAIALKACAVALEKFPQFNASIDMNAETVVYKKYVHIGVAVDTPRGLLVPVIRDCDAKSILDLAVELTQASERARNSKTSLEEMQGGCFSISNLGGIGGVGFSPIVNSPEVAILGMSRAQMEPVWHEESFEPRLMLPLSLSYDHRLIDGADAARFLRFICESLEQPLLLAM